MNITIQPEIKMEIRQCICGEYPKFIKPNPNYSDTWLQCNCGRYTENTGGFYYGKEISEKEARITAVELWNKEEIMEIYK